MVFLHLGLTSPSTFGRCSAIKAQPKKIKGDNFAIGVRPENDECPKWRAMFSSH